MRGWVENPYWQYLSGMEFFCHEPPIDPSSMSRWRSRVGEAGGGELLRETIEAGLRLKVIKPSELRRVNVDTTVQEKHIRFPTDPRLYDRMRQRLVGAAREEGVSLRQSYVRVGKRLLAQQSRYAHAKQWGRARKCTRKLRAILGRVIRDIERKALDPGEELRGLLALARRLHLQKRHDKGKLYSVHAPEVECISKGKAHKRYEFGSKVALAVSSKGGWVLAAQALEGNPYDGHTLQGTMDRIVSMSRDRTRARLLRHGLPGPRLRGRVPGACGPSEAGRHRQLGVALDEAAGGDRAFHRPSQGGQADAEVSAEGNAWGQGQRRPQRGGHELLQAPGGPRSFVVVFGGWVCRPYFASFASWNHRSDCRVDFFRIELAWPTRTSMSTSRASSMCTSRFLRKAGSTPHVLLLERFLSTSWLCSTVTSESWRSIVDSSHSSEPLDEL